MQTLVVGCLAQLPLATGLPQAALRIAQRCRHMRAVVSGTRSEYGIRPRHFFALRCSALLCSCQAFICWLTDLTCISRDVVQRCLACAS
jgi:hypothetical protein